MSIADEVLVLVGGATKALDYNNPFTYDERKELITKAILNSDRARSLNLVEKDLDRIATIYGLRDHPYNDEKWVEQVQAIVEEHKFMGHNTTITLMGHLKDDSSFYLKLFPQWDFIDVEFKNELSAVDIRKEIYTNGISNYIKYSVPETTYAMLEDKYRKGEFELPQEEYEYTEAYHKSWEGSPFPVQFITADAVVVQQGHILLVKRGNMPGKGLWAMPGGFVNANEYIKDAAIRELREETRLKVPEPVLRGSIVAQKVYDRPKRSLRGRTVTTAFLIHLKNYDQGLPKVKGSDDAAEAQWVPLSLVTEQENLFFEDHFHIIQDMIGRL